MSRARPDVRHVFRAPGRVLREPSGCQDDTTVCDDIHRHALVIDTDAGDLAVVLGNAGQAGLQGVQRFLEAFLEKF